MQLYYTPEDHVAHRIALIATIKDVPCELLTVDLDSKESWDEDLQMFNPSMLLPAIKNKEIILAGQGVLMEYFEERYPYPPLYPLLPADRAQMRWAVMTIQTKLGRFLDLLIHTKDKKVFQDATKASFHYMQSAIEEMVQTEFVGKEAWNLVDCTLVPILWRLYLLGVSFEESPLSLDYLEKRTSSPIFERSSDSFDDALYQEIAKKNA